METQEDSFEASFYYDASEPEDAWPSSKNPRPTTLASPTKNPRRILPTTVSAGRRRHLQVEERHQGWRSTKEAESGF
jgi:hypothetical protein